ncbi:hypothetical protein [Pseudactinotalea sp. HY158]|uniref:hypothetical protein n=1 Tax=Pseudactinotalea sp. HY158 TaxID=2654547 RepID=UPI00129CABD1|nr:hypothetical protein [Pseudactinotalea sp. HY158]QGH70394.1 hypothetical protein GCE65_13515 [Pseudactinotalea sp. HY158]
MELQRFEREVVDDSAMLARLRRGREVMDEVMIERLALAAMWVEHHPYVIAAEDEGEDTLAHLPPLVVEATLAQKAEWDQIDHDARQREITAIHTAAANNNSTSTRSSGGSTRSSGGSSRNSGDGPDDGARASLLDRATDPASRPLTAADLVPGVGSGQRGLWTVEEYSISTFAAGAGMGLDAAQRLLLEAEQLRTRLPLLFARALAGRVRVWRARQIAAATLFLSVEACGFVDSQLSLVPLNFGRSQLDGLIKEALIRHMPTEYEAAEQAADQGPARDVTFTHAETATGDSRMHAVLPAADGRILQDVIDHLAGMIQAQGWDLPAGDLRAYALGDLARARYGHTPLPGCTPTGPDQPAQPHQPVPPDRQATPAHPGESGRPGEPGMFGRICPPSDGTAEQAEQAGADEQSGTSEQSSTPGHQGAAGHQGSASAAGHQGAPDTGGAGVPRGRILMYLHLQAADLWPGGLPTTSPPRPPGGPDHPDTENDHDGHDGRDPGDPGDRGDPGDPDDSSDRGDRGVSGAGARAAGGGFDRERLRRVPVRVEARGLPRGAVITAAELGSLFHRPTTLPPAHAPAAPGTPAPGPQWTGVPEGPCLNGTAAPASPGRPGTVLPGTGLPGTVLPGTVLSGEGGSGSCFVPEIIVRPILDLDEPLATDSYTPTERMRTQAILTTDRCAFPWCTRTARACDLDHIDAWHTTTRTRHDRHAAQDGRDGHGGNDAGGSDAGSRSGEGGGLVVTGGATCPCNLAPLCRAHHRLKTHAHTDSASRGRHAAWSYAKLDTGTYLWTGPHGIRLLRTPWGTLDTQATTGPIGPIETAESIETAQHTEPAGSCGTGEHRDTHENTENAATSGGTSSGTGAIQPATSTTTGTPENTALGTTVRGTSASGPIVTARASGAAHAADTTRAPGVEAPPEATLPAAPAPLSPQRERANRAHWSQATPDTLAIVHSRDTRLSDRADTTRAAHRAAEEDDARRYPDEPPF